MRQRQGTRPPSGRTLPVLLIALFVLVAVRLVWLQVIDAPSLRERADDAHSSSVTIQAKRGTIYDRNGNVLAMSVECRTLYCNPRAVTDDDAVAQVLADNLGGEASDYTETLGMDTTFAYIQRKVDTEVAKKVLSDLAAKKLEGVYALTDTMRTYPYGALAGQVLGFIGTDGHGLSGIELQYDDVLSGADGSMEMEVGRDGTPVAGGAYSLTEATDGTDIIISIDANIQTVAEEQLAKAVSDSKAESGNVTVLDPETGEILAACSWPLYDPTDDSTLTDESLKLTSVSDSYEPGSTFKILTMAVGLDSGKLTNGTTFSVPAKVKVGDDWVGDDDGRDYTMDMDVREILRRSSNAGAALAGESIGADVFSEGIARLGIGSKTGIDFPGEASGIVTARADYTGATLGAMSFGQSVAIPAMQVVRAVAAIANGGVITTPHFLVQQGPEVASWPDGGRVISEQAASTLTDDLVTVVEEGTGRKAQVKGYSIAGKTGTGEQASSEGGYAGGRFMSSFVGYGPSDDAKVLVYVGINGTAQHGGTAAAPAFSAIMGEALGDMGVEPAS